MKNIIKFLQNLYQRTQEIPKPLGRWNIDYCNKKISNKVDLSNEDHCGPCGQYALKTINEDHDKKSNNINKTIIIDTGDHIKKK
jgi:hypothetical protein